MTKRKKPADLARDVIKLLQKKEFNLPRPSFGSGYPEAIAKIAGKICAGASIEDLAEFTNSWRQSHRQHFITRDQTLLHLFASTSPNSMAKEEYETVLNAMRILLVPNPRTGALHFDLEHHDDVHGETPLHLAARTPAPEVCRILLEAGANATALSTGGCHDTPPAKPLEVALQSKVGNQEAAHVIRAWLAKRAIDQVLKQNEPAPATSTQQP